MRSSPTLWSAILDRVKSIVLLYFRRIRINANSCYRGKLLFFLFYPSKSRIYFRRVVKLRKYIHAFKNMMCTSDQKHWKYLFPAIFWRKNLEILSALNWRKSSRVRFPSAKWLFWFISKDILFPIEFTKVLSFFVFHLVSDSLIRLELLSLFYRWMISIWCEQ